MLGFLIYKPYNLLYYSIVHFKINFPFFIYNDLIDIKKQIFFLLKESLKIVIQKSS